MILDDNDSDNDIICDNDNHSDNDNVNDKIFCKGDAALVQRRC